MIYRHVAESINGKTYFLNELGVFFPTNSKCLLCVILNIWLFKDATLHFVPWEANCSFFPLACCLMVLLPVILSLTLAFTKKSSWLVNPFHCHRKSGSIQLPAPKGQPSLCCLYILTPSCVSSTPQVYDGYFIFLLQ